MTRSKGKAKKDSGSKVIVYSTESCPWCHKAKEFFEEKKVPFTDVNVGEDEDARNKMIEKSGQMGVPVIDINGKIIVGFDQEAIEEALGGSGDLKQAA